MRGLKVYAMSLAEVVKNEAKNVMNRRGWWLWLALFLGAPVSAVEVPGLYEGQVFVPNQSAAVRKEGIRAALLEVLSKLTGRRAVASDPAFAPWLGSAESWARQYGYQSLTDEWRATLPPGTQGQILVVNFDRSAVTQALDKASIAQWPRDRPRVLAAVVWEQGGQNWLLSPGLFPEVESTLKIQAQRRGLALTLPLRPEEDPATLILADVWPAPLAGVAPKLASAGIDLLWTGVLTASTPGQWRVRWSLYDQELKTIEPARWESGGASFAQALGEGVESLADMLGKRYARVTAPAQTFMVQVMETNGLRDYARAQAQLRRLDSVTDVQAQRIVGTTVWFAVTARVSQEELMRAIAVAGSFSPLEVRLEGRAEPMLQYRLMP